MVDPYRYPSFRIDRVLLEEHSFRVIAFGGPFHDLREYARAGRGYLRVYPRLRGPYRANSRLHRSREAIHHDPLVGRRRFAKPHIKRYQGTGTLANGDRRDLVERSPQRDLSPRLRTTAIHLRRTPGGMPIQYVLQAPTLDKLQEFLPTFMQKVNESPVFQMADVNLRFTKPEARIEIDRDKASLLGVSTRNIAQTLQYALSGQRMGYFYMKGKQYQILGEINRQQRNTPVDLKSIYVRSNNGEMIQLDNLVKVTENVAPPQLYRYNRFVSATVSSGLNKGYTIGDGLDEMDRIASEVLDGSFRTALSGESKEFRESSSSLMFAMILALLMIYLVLAAQFESFKDPLVVMFTVPLAIAGALMFMSYSGITMNIFSQIGIIMLIGLVAKNGILIVEFANQRQESGLSLPEAIRSSATQRLRPILMTSVSTILGLVPLVYATGEGAQGRIAMGVAVVGGMLVSTFLTLFIVPAMYSFISTNRKKQNT